MILKTVKDIRRSLIEEQQFRVQFRICGDSLRDFTIFSIKDPLMHKQWLYDFIVLLGSLDSVAEVSLDEQDKATAKPKAPPGVTDNEMTGMDESEKLAVL
ncbi:Centrosomal protein of 162 kDa [Camelus dromedarius]|uniref:Centrosomal protein of 162 kDa n=1 Tax=Camelus dromedarius TaxID=9838 RepID=A0A5N4CUP9_CAMDR|nr:Centrosomal protein of 162 kDa [Camelus dromedarius]